ncbi:MAG: hypothetical protein LBC40_00350 [Dysgonamonadaceae bacterium]|jgi:hypothetical protein|nr:hypothetical protein [Dysgonamonadaceae bacterium]
MCQVKVWFTQPRNSFASCYAYNKGTKNFVRIRLELGRKSIPGHDINSGKPKIMVKKNRYVGFSKDAGLDISETSYWSVDGDKIKYKETTGKEEILSLDSSDGLVTYDFSLKPGTSLTKNVHKGNPVTPTPTLPEGITSDEIQQLAISYLGEKEGSILLTSTSSFGEGTIEKRLVEALIRAGLKSE